MFGFEFCKQCKKEEKLKIEEIKIFIRNEGVNEEREGKIWKGREKKVKIDLKSN